MRGLREQDALTFSEVLSWTLGPEPGGGGAWRFFISDFPEAPERLPRDLAGPRLQERGCSDGELGVVRQPCRENRHEQPGHPFPTDPDPFLRRAGRLLWSCWRAVFMLLKETQPFPDSRNPPVPSELRSDQPAGSSDRSRREGPGAGSPWRPVLALPPAAFRAGKPHGWGLLRPPDHL